MFERIREVTIKGCTTVEHKCAFYQTSDLWGGSCKVWNTSGSKFEEPGCKHLCLTINSIGSTNDTAAWS